MRARAPATAPWLEVALRKLSVTVPWNIKPNLKDTRSIARQQRVSDMVEVGAALSATDRAIETEALVDRLVVVNQQLEKGQARAQERVSELRFQNKTQSESASRELRALQRRCNELQAQNSRLLFKEEAKRGRGETASADEEVETLRSDIRRMTAQYQAALGARDSERSHAVQERATAEERAAAARRELASVFEALQAADAALGALRGRNAALEGTLAREGARLQALHDEREQAVRELQVFQTNHARCETRDQQITVLQEKLADMTSRQAKDQELKQLYEKKWRDVRDAHADCEQTIATQNSLYTNQSDHLTMVAGAPLPSQPLLPTGALPAGVARSSQPRGDLDQAVMPPPPPRPTLFSGNCKRFSKTTRSWFRSTSESKSSSTWAGRKSSATAIS
jgi:chromosome segregation ATPase